MYTYEQRIKAVDGAQAPSDSLIRSLQYQPRCCLTPAIKPSMATPASYANLWFIHTDRRLTERNSRSSESSVIELIDTEPYGSAYKEFRKIVRNIRNNDESVPAAP